MQGVCVGCVCGENGFVVVGARIEGVGNVLACGDVVSKTVVGYYGEVFDKNI